MALKKTPIKEEIIGPIPEQEPEAVAAAAPEPVKAAAPNLVPVQPKYLVYIGPSIRGHIGKNAIIRQDQFKALDRSLEAYPSIKHLLVTGDQIAAARAMIRQPDSYLHAVYAQLIDKA